MTSQDHAAATERLLRAIRSFGDAHDRMSAGLRRGMDMNFTDIATLRLLIMAEEKGAKVTPIQISRHLGISTASTTKLVDRLEKSGHVRRSPHPTDRRARVITLTDAARQEFYEQFGQVLMRIRGAADQFDTDDLMNAVRVLSAVEGALQEDTTR